MTSSSLRYDEQENEDYYDERDNADDDLQKGQLVFSKKKLYGRDKELAALLESYEHMMNSEVTTGGTSGTTSKKTTSSSPQDNEVDSGGEVRSGGDVEAVMAAAATDAGDDAAPGDEDPAAESDSADGEDDDDTGGGQPQIVFLPGYSGTGKSALVETFLQQIHKQQEQQRPPTSNPATSPILSSSSTTEPRFITGKYEESYTSQSYSALAVGLNQYFGTILEKQQQLLQQQEQEGEQSAGDDDEYDVEIFIGEENDLFKRLRHILGDYSHYLGDIIPNISIILGDNDGGNSVGTGGRGGGGGSVKNDHGSVATKSTRGDGSHTRSSSKLTSDRNVNLVKHIFRNLITSLCSRDHPIILFLDDLQWIDEQSLDLLSTLLLDKSLQYLYFIGAYRSNEVTENHPVSIFIKDLQQKSLASAAAAAAAAAAASTSPTPTSSSSSSGFGFQIIELQELTDHDIGEFIMDTLQMEDTQTVEPLTKAIYPKTLGNIFFTMQAMEELVRKNGIYYDVMTFTWQWNIRDHIEMSKLLSDDVIAMVQSKITTHLPPPIQRLLIVFAYTRSILDVPTLQLLLLATNSIKIKGDNTDDAQKQIDKAMEQIIAGLKMAVNAGLLVGHGQPTSHSHHHRQNTQDSTSGLEDSVLSMGSLSLNSKNRGGFRAYRFVHDRIQEAAQGLISGDEKDKLRYQIAMELDRIHQSNDHAAEDWMLFTAAYHLNTLPREYVEAAAKQLKSQSSFDGFKFTDTNTIQDKIIINPIRHLIRLNIRAAKLAIDRSGFRPAVDFLRNGLSCLEFDRRKNSNQKHGDNTDNSNHNKWDDRQYDLHLELYNLLLENEYTIGNLGEAQRAIDEVLNNAKCQKDKLLAQYYDVEIITSQKERDYELAVERGIKHLSGHGIVLPSNPSEARIMKERINLQVVMGRRNLHDLVDLPPMNEDDEDVMRLVAQLSANTTVAGYTRLGLMTNLTAQRLSWKLGINVHLPAMLPHYAVNLRSQGKLKEAYQIASLGREMIHKVCHGPPFVQGLHVVNAGVITTVESYASVIDSCSEVYRVGLSCGDCKFGLLQAMILCHAHFCAGWPVNSLFEAKIARYIEEANRYGLPPPIVVTFKICHQALLNLKHDVRNPTLLFGKALDQEKTLAQFKGNPQKQTLRDIAIYRLMLACVYGDGSTMAEMVDLLQTYPEFDLCESRQYLRDVFVAFAASYLSSNKKDKQDSKKYRQLVRAKLKWFQKLVKNGSKNAPPIVLCLQAFENPSGENYEAAIESCSKYDLMHVDAIMREWYGLYLLDDCGERGDDADERQKGKQVVGEAYLTDSMWLYHDWGAMGKVTQMRQQHNFLKLARRRGTRSLPRRYLASQSLTQSSTEYEGSSDILLGSELFTT